ncbi:MAG: VCBS repeat-containing protein [Planctomycetales bacterium]
MIRFQWLHALRNHSPLPLANRRKRRLNGTRSAIQSLEQRTLLSATKIGVETRINNTVTNDQRTPDVAMAPNGDYVVVWHSFQTGDADIYGQRYSAYGTRLGTEFRINVTTTGTQVFPTIAMDPSGNFVVAWSGDQGQPDYEVYCRRFNAAGVALSGDILVNTTLAGSHRYPDIAMDSAGDFVIGWSDPNIGNMGFQAFNSSGQKVGTEILRKDGSNNYGDPSIAMGPNGDFVIAWDVFTSGFSGILAQRFDSYGVPQGGVFQVDLDAPQDGFLPAAAMDAFGNVVISWVSNGKDGDGWGIYARRFDAANNPLGPEFRVNTSTPGNQYGPAIAMSPNGNFDITWSSIDPATGFYDVYAKMYNAQGKAITNEFRVNTYTTLEQQSASVAADADGNFMVVWESNGRDTSGYGIYGQLYARKTDFVGVQRGGSFYLDSNHNDNYEGGTTTADDILTTFGGSGDIPLVGDWNGDGFDDIGIWRNGFFYLDANGNGVYDGSVTDRYFSFGLTTDTPIVGDWNGDGIDDVGVWRAGKFYVDLNGDRAFGATDGTWSFGVATDTPIVGDWNGDGKDDIGVWRAGLFYMDLNGNHQWDRTPSDRVYEFGLSTDKPIIGDWNGDGKDDIGVRRAARFWIDGNANGKWDGAVDDYFIDFGNASGDVPLIGFWRPRAVPGTPPAAPAGISITAPALEQVAAPTVTAAQIDPGVTRKSGTAKSTALGT